MSFTKEVSPDNWLVRFGSQSRCEVKVEIQMDRATADRLVAWDANWKAKLDTKPSKGDLGSAILERLMLPGLS